ncbi:related to protein kinase [Rhynchosporium secalis]|uniref:Related to protein kinase n=1 Tax=Rhynchosporium secalis TaxID=38038 RepID=A0A1E1MQS8_RHYSE|nr:related to protein kinase [Rhynchosporium secalis]
MDRLFRQTQQLIQRTTSPHGISSRVMSSQFVNLDNMMDIEEETMSTNGLYYPVRLGEVFKSRYEVLSKLGYGANSTVWFCRDLQQQKYAALKHVGKAYVRSMIDSFVAKSAIGDHHCLVHEPLLLNLLELQAILPRKRLSLDLLKRTLRHLLLSLDYLHTEAAVVHSDIQARNILLGTIDQSVYSDMDAAEVQEPSPRKINGDSIIYQSRRFHPQAGFTAWGLPVLCDLGEARIGSKHTGIIQPNSFRAPEVVLGMEWDCKVDIWNLGVMAWHLFEDDHLFDGRILGQHSDAQLLAEMTSVLGPPPSSFLEQIEAALKYWGSQGNWKGVQGTEIKSVPLEDCEEYLEGKEYDMFVGFFKRMFVWNPKERATARELLQDEFLIVS